MSICFDYPLLLTGASGVVGSEVANLFESDQLLLARHRVSPSSNSKQIAIDIRQPQLGLPDAEYTELSRGISGIIHSAAITDMNGVADGLRETNIDGVRNIIALAIHAKVPLHYVSTAYCSKTYGPKHPVDSAYVQSKRTAEQLVRDSGLDWTIVRPSIVVGHSSTGAISNFQGFHLFVTSILKGRLQMVPLEASARCDFIPVNYVAKAIAEVVTNPTFGETYWLTGGPEAITVAQMMTVGQPFAKQYGKDLSEVPICDPETFRRERLPELTQRLSPRLLERFNVLLELSTVMTTERPFPSNLKMLLPKTMLLNEQVLQDTLLNNLEYWGASER